MVESFLDIGKGYSAMEQFCLSMGMSCMSSSNFNCHLKNITSESRVVREEVLSDARKVVRQAHIDLNPELAAQEIIDITVSFDGTWHKRGHTSLYGIGVVVDILTGIVLDYELLSRYCGICTMKKKELQKEEFSVWYKDHKEKGECDCNFDRSGSS